MLNQQLVQQLVHQGNLEFLAGQGQDSHDQEECQLNNANNVGDEIADAVDEAQIDVNIEDLQEGIQNIQQIGQIIICSPTRMEKQDLQTMNMMN